MLRRVVTHLDALTIIIAVAILNNCCMVAGNGKALDGPLPARESQAFEKPGNQLVAHGRIVIPRRSESLMFTDLQTAIDAAQDGDRIFLGPRKFSASPLPYRDTSCANCPAHLKKLPEIDTTLGFRVRGKSLKIIGAGQAVTILVTRAGFGVFIEDAQLTISGLSITGGDRSTSEYSTDAGIVVRRGSLNAFDLRIRWNNAQRPGQNPHPGIAGIAGRQGAVIKVNNAVIEHNSWDGMVLYDDAQGEISDSTIAFGKGVGIAATWRSRLKAVRNQVSGYWKGIGSFGEAEAVIMNNLVANQSGWGIALLSSRPAKVINNTVVNTANCGLTMWGTASRGEIVNNIIYRSGTSKPWICPRAGLLWNDHILTGQHSEAWRVHYNYSFESHDGNDFIRWRNQVDGTPYFRMPASLLSTNRALTPGFGNGGPYILPADSPLLHQGDPSIANPDGSRSHPGMQGGPEAVK